jgi:NAD(P)H-dependent flavin oxidoreductase YrpB (nitropropane dioxygenase family)
MNNQLTETFGIEYPIFAFSHCRDVVAAVTNAGGMGVLGALAFSPDQLELELKWIDEHVGGRPYGVDVVMPVKSVDREQGIDDAGDIGAKLRELIPQTHWDYVDKILADHGVDVTADTEALESGAGMGAGVLGWTEATGAPQIEIALGHPIALLASALGPPPKAAIDQAHEQGVKVAALIGRVEQAVRDVQQGVDIIIAQGYEAGGHTGEVATMVLIPDVVDAIDVPVLAAGGIGSGRQMAAAMALGADGVWTGSIWLTVTENTQGGVVTDKLLAATSTDTVRSRAFTGKPARQLRTGWTEAWEAPESPGPLPMPLQFILNAYATRKMGANPPRELVGMPVGQIVSRMNQLRSSKSVINEMVEEYVDITTKLVSDLEG